MAFLFIISFSLLENLLETSMSLSFYLLIWTEKCSFNFFKPIFLSWRNFDFPLNLSSAKQHSIDNTLYGFCVSHSLFYLIFPFSHISEVNSWFTNDIYLLFQNVDFRCWFYFSGISEHLFISCFLLTSLQTIIVFLLFLIFMFFRVC